MTRLIIVAILLLAGVAWGGDVINLPAPAPKFLIDPEGRVLIPPVYTEERSGTTTMPVDFEKQRLIRQWAADGSICKVLGHRWKAIPIDPTWFREQRYCPICGKTETKVEEWK